MNKRKELNKHLISLGCKQINDNVRYFEYSLKTSIGLLFIRLDLSAPFGALFCNFIGSEQKAKAKYGHWKQNTFLNRGANIQEIKKEISIHLNQFKN